jgi:hypothetical protein
MSVTSDENNVTLIRTKLKYLTKKKDNYENELFYHVIEAGGFWGIVENSGDDMK